MTYASCELRERGVSEEIIAWRRWRRAMHLTQGEAAAMANVHERTLLCLELGLTHPRAATLEKLRRLMARWMTPLAERRGRYQRDARGRFRREEATT